MRKIGKGTFWFLDKALSFGFLTVVILVILLTVVIETSNYHIVADAQSSQYRIYKPTEEDTVSYESLAAVNSDVIGWLTLDGTGIDYPLVQGENNHKYVNTAVTGEFSLTGAIFLDARNQPQFTDPVSILYGHNMAGDAMFGTLDLYEDPDYFQKHLSGTLYHDGRYDTLSVFAYFHGDGQDTTVYNPRVNESSLGQWLEEIDNRAINKAEQAVEKKHVLLMSTCAAGETNGRRLLAAWITPGAQKEQTQKNDSRGIIPKQMVPRVSTAESIKLPWTEFFLYGGILVAITAVYWIIRIRMRKKNVGIDG